MTITRDCAIRARRLLFAAAALSLGGCSDGVELNGKLFDALGVSAAAQSAKSAEPKMAVRSSLVLPPDPSRLPEPGSGTDAPAATLATIVDPDEKRATDAAERKRMHARYCSGEFNWKERLQDPNARPTSPYGPCGTLGEALLAK